jgi:hypothetical protein
LIYLPAAGPSDVCLYRSLASSVALTYKHAKGYSVQACGLLKNDVHITHKNSVITSHVKNPPILRYKHQHVKNHIMHRKCILTHVIKNRRDKNMRKKTSADIRCPS